MYASFFKQRSYVSPAKLCVYVIIIFCPRLFFCFVFGYVKNWNCNNYLVSQEAELTQSKTLPTATTKSIITIYRNMKLKCILMKWKQGANCSPKSTSWKICFQSNLDNIDSGKLCCWQSTMPSWWPHCWPTNVRILGHSRQSRVCKSCSNENLNSMINK